MQMLQIKEIAVNGTSSTLWGGLHVSFEVTAPTAGPQVSIAAAAGNVSLLLLTGAGEKLVQSRPLAGLWGQAASRGAPLQSLAEATFPFDPLTLERLDELRAGGNLMFKLSLRLQMISTDLPGKSTRYEAFGSGTAAVPRSDWAERILPAAGYERYEMWEVRRLGQTAHPMLNDERARMRQAIHAFNHGNWKGAFTESREAVKSLRLRRTELNVATDPKVMDKLSGFLSQALHVEELPTAWEPSRSDAVLAVSAAKGVLDWTESLLAAAHNPPS